MALKAEFHVPRKWLVPCDLKRDVKIKDKIIFLERKDMYVYTLLQLTLSARESTLDARIWCLWTSDSDV